MGRQDCSLCKYTDPKYRCVWCSKQKACVYEKLCSAHQHQESHNIECPNPEIIDVSNSDIVDIVSCLLLKWKQCFPLRLVISSEMILTLVIDQGSLLAV